jgi:hypothetical protein
MFFIEPTTSKRLTRGADLPPINRATGKLVKSDIEGVVGHEEAVYG